MNKIMSYFYNFKNKINLNLFKHKHIDYEDDDYEDDEYNSGNIKFIWGIKSFYDLTDCEANLYTLNDIDILYDRETKSYLLSIETSYSFDKVGETNYLNDLLKAFKSFMINNNYDTEYPYDLFANQSDVYKASSIPELYTQFRIFVEGYKSVYEKEK